MDEHGAEKMNCCGTGFAKWHDDADRIIHQAQDRWRQPRTSGSRAFDEYRVATLRRLEDVQREFHDFLGRLRMAEDKAEFDQFMAERRAPTEPPAAAPPA
jgi:Protein of unknown function (DUF2852)